MKGVANRLMFGRGELSPHGCYSRAGLSHGAGSAPERIRRDQTECRAARRRSRTVRRSDRVRASYGAGPEKLVLMYAGRLSNEKRVSLLVEALLKLPADLQAVLWLVGHGPMHEDIEAMTALVPSLRLLPYETDRARFAAMLASADIYVTAGPHEAFALSVIEAQASGLPAVGIDAGALRDRIPPGTGYLGPVDDADAMAANIVRAAAER